MLTKSEVTVNCVVAVEMFTLSLQNIFDSDRYGTAYKCKFGMCTCDVGHTKCGLVLNSYHFILQF